MHRAGSRKTFPMQSHLSPCVRTQRMQLEVPNPAREGSSRKINHHNRD